MRIFVAFEDVRLPLDVQPGQTVGDVKTVLREHFKLNSSHVEGKILQLSYAGAILHDSWVCSDIGISSGSTVKSVLRDSDKPVLHVDCAFNEEIITMREQFDPATTRVGALRSKISAKTGLPVSVFRLCTATQREMFDVHTLERYGVKLGDTIHLHVWDGWTGLLLAATQGHTRKVLKNASADEQISKYQFRVACYIAAHFGHVDLANSLINPKLGACKPEEPVGQHPGKLWSKDSAHVDTWKCPVHEAAQFGMLNVLKIFVQNNICCLVCKDGRGHNPVTVGCRHGQTDCVTYLTSKLYSSHTENTITLPVIVVIKSRKWCERARESVLTKQGAYLSSLKRRPYKPAATIGHGVVVDGFGESPLQSRSKVSELMYLNNLSRDAGLILPSMNRYRPIRTTRGQRRLASHQTAKESSQRRSRTWKVSTGSNSINAPPGTNRFPSLTATVSSPRYRAPSRGGDDGFRDDVTEASSYIQTPKAVKADLPDICKGGKAPASRRAKTIEGGLSLPAVSVENTLRPFFHVSSKLQNPVLLTLGHFDKYRGTDSRHSAIQCMIVAGTFKDKAWLRQVDMAISLARRNVTNCLSRSVSVLDDLARGLPKVAASPIKIQM